MDERMKIGIIYDTKENYGIEASDLTYCDFSHLSDVEFVRDQLELAGYKVELIDKPENIVNYIEKRTFDLLLNMAEGFKSRNREILVPIICETFNIPYIGTDAFGLVFTNHKFQTKLLADYLGVSTPQYYYFDHHIHTYKSLELLFKDRVEWFPLVIKPNHEGSSMGVEKISNLSTLIETAKRLVKLYDQGLIIEKFIEGADVLSYIIGTSDKAKVCPPVEVVDLKGNSFDLWDSERKMDNAEYRPARLLDETAKIIEEQSLLLHNALHLYDLSRMDWRVDATGTPFFLEATPIPSLSEVGSFSCCAESMGLAFMQLLKIVVESAQERLNVIPKTKGR